MPDDGHQALNKHSKNTFIHNYPLWVITSV